MIEPIGSIINFWSEKLSKLKQLDSLEFEIKADKRPELDQICSELDLWGYLSSHLSRFGEAWRSVFEIEKVLLD